MGTFLSHFCPLSQYPNLCALYLYVEFKFWTLNTRWRYSPIQGGRGLDWLELDTPSPSALRRVRDRAAMPIASLESVMGRRALLPFLEADAVDVAIVDPLWNGVDESCKMAALCDIFEVELTY